MKKFFAKLLSIFNFKHEAAIKLISILLAILFWVFVMDKENPVITRVFYNIPVSYVGELGEDLVVSSAPRYYANVEVSGRRNSVLAARSDYIKLTVDYADLVDGSNKAVVEISSNLTDVSIVSVNPSNVPVVLEKIISAEKPVTYYYSAPFDDTLKSSYIRVNPAQMVVSGPRSLVGRVVELAGYIDASTISESKTFELLVTPVDSMGEVVNGVSVTGNTVTAAISAVRTKTVPIAAQFEDETDEGYELNGYTLSKTEAVISGDPEYIDAVSELRADTVVVSGFESVKGNLIFNVSDGINIQDADEFTYSAEVLKIETAEFVYSPDEIKLIGLGDLQRAVLPDDYAAVITIRGFLREIQDVSKSDFELSLDLSGYEDGVHTAALSVATGEHLDTDNEHVVFEITQGSEITFRIETEKEEE